MNCCPTARSSRIDARRGEAHNGQEHEARSDSYGEAVGEAWIDFRIDSWFDACGGGGKGEAFGDQRCEAFDDES